MTDMWEDLKTTGFLTSQFKERIIEKYGKRGEKALKIVEDGKIKRYNDFFVVTGTKEEHVVESEFCTCRDFQRRGALCAHIIAIKIASVISIYEEIDSWYQDIYREM